MSDSLLDLLNMSHLSFSMIIPNATVYSICGPLSHSWHFGLNIPLKNVTVFVSSICNSVHVGAPGQVTGDVNPQILSTADGFQDLAL